MQIVATKVQPRTKPTTRPVLDSVESGGDLLDVVAAGSGELEVGVELGLVFRQLSLDVS